MTLNNALKTSSTGLAAERFRMDVISANIANSNSMQIGGQMPYRRRVVELMGTPENVAMAEYVFHFLWNKVQAFWKDYSKVTGKGAASRRSYMLGVMSGFRDKLRQADQTPAGVPSETRALIKAADRELEEFVSFRHPKLTQRRWGGGRGDQGSFNAGVRDGGTITIHRGITKESGNRGLRLGAGK